MLTSVQSLKLDAPRVTVALALYNGARFVRIAAESVLRQTLRNIELIIVDDGSTDEGADLADALARGDARVRVLRHAHAGIARTTNHALAEARGVYFAPMDQDDIALPERLSLLSSFLDHHPDVAAVSGRADIIGDDGLPPAGASLRTPPLHAADALKHQCALVHPASMMRTDVLRRIGGYRPEFAFAHDYDLFLRIAEVAEVANIPDRVLLKRRHARQVTADRHQRSAQVVAGAVAYLSRLSRTEMGHDMLREGESLEAAGARFIVEYLAGNLPLRSDVVHHFSRFLRYAPLHRDGQREPIAAYLRYLASATRTGGLRELARTGYYVASFHIAGRAAARRAPAPLARTA